MPNADHEFGVLTQDSCEGGTDYTLNEDAVSCWIIVDDISVYIRRDTCGGVRVELFPDGDESARDPIDAAWAKARKVKA